MIDALCILHGINQTDVKIIQEKKRNERGSFSGRMFVTIAEHAEGGWAEKYCSARPEKYPEIT